MQSRWGLHAASGLTNRTPLEGGGGTIYPGSRPADVTTRSPRMVAECLHTRSMLIKMFYHHLAEAGYWLLIRLLVTDSVYWLLIRFTGYWFDLLVTLYWFELLVTDSGY